MTDPGNDNAINRDFELVREPDSASGGPILPADGPVTHPSKVQSDAAYPEVLSDSSATTARGAGVEPLPAEESAESETIVKRSDQHDPSVLPRSPHVKRHGMRRLPNCRITGIDYQASLADAVSEFSQNDIQKVAISEKSIADLALQWNGGTFEISCHPSKAGEFEIDLCVDVHRYERHIFPFMLTVNPDPKTLWKNIPSDQSGIYSKADSDKAFLECSSKMSIVAASQRGRSHAQDGKPRDDHFAMHYDKETDCAYLIVADGAGSAKFSREGSRIAALTALDKVRSGMNPAFWSALMPSIEKWVIDRDASADKSIKKALYVLIQAAWDAKASIKQEAKDHESRYLATYKKAESFTARDYATTLILTIAKRLESGGWIVATYWAGDGGMGIYRPGAAEVFVQGTPDGGEYGGQTRFLTEDSAEVWPQDANKLIARRLRFDVIDSFDAVILMTDGVSDPRFETERNLVSIAKWNELWADLSKSVPFGKRDGSVADALLEWMDFWSPGNHDDRTMVILY